MKRLQRFMAIFALVAGVVSTAFLSVNVAAVEVFDECGANADAAVCAATGDDATDLIGTVIDTALFVLGMIAVLMIVIGGIRYTTSNGESSKIKEAKDTILYSVIGLIVAVLSYSIVNFVLGRFD
jgi:glucose uptake protein GlcU